MDKEKPEEYLRKHPLTLELKRLGVTEDQLRSMRFRPSNHGWQFSHWSYTSAADTPHHVLNFIKSYCALKWLVLDNPSCSRDTEDAHELISETMNASIVRIGMRHAGAQKARAQKPRGKVTDDGKTVTQMIRALTLQPEYLNERAKELWPHFFAQLDSHGLYPREINHPIEPKKCAYVYETKNGIKQITYGRFANMVSQYRSRKKSR